MIIHNKFPLRFAGNEFWHFNGLFHISPCFTLHSSKIRIINEPREYYETLCEKFKNATRRISVASLYIGTGELEQKLVNILQNTVQSKAVKLSILLDFQRGLRGEKNSCTMLQNMVDTHPNKCDIHLYQTPRLSGSWSKFLPSRYNELVGVQHMKLYIADDTVILSGANLSHVYFHKRQDRYVQIEDPDLADFYSELIEKVNSYSKELKSEGKITDSLVVTTMSPSELKIHAAKEFETFIKEWMKVQEAKAIDNCTSCDTVIFPLIQMGDYDIKQDERTMLCMLSSAPKNSEVRLATGYFNLTQSYAETLLYKCAAQTSLLMAHPKANGFLGEPGPAGGIPYAYTLIAQKFWDQVKHLNKIDSIVLKEYERKQWTFHAKGLWYYPPNCNRPWATVVGSANLGERSVRRDLEAQAAIFTLSPDLQAKLQEECDNLHKYSSDCSKVLHQRKVPLWVRAIVTIFKSFF